MTPEAPKPAAGTRSASAEHDAERDRLAEILLEHSWEIVSETLFSRLGDIYKDAVSSAVRSGDEIQVRCARAVALQIKTLTHAYRGILRTKFDEATAVLLGRRSAHAKPQSGLSLVELDESDMANQLGQLTARLRNSVQVPFAALLQRLQALVGSEHELQEADVPLRPGMFLEALSENLSSVIPGHGEATSLLRHFPGAIESPLIATYEAINRFLESKGIAPATVVHRTPVKRAAPPPTIRAELPAALDALAGGADALSAPAEAASAVRPIDKASSPNRAAPLRGAGFASVARREGAAAAGESLMLEYARLQALVGVNASSLVEAAHNAALGRESSVAQAPPKLTELMLAAQRLDAEFLAGKQRQIGPGAQPGKDSAKELVSTREYSLQLVAAATQPLHKLAIQLVARLFTRIERDRLVPAPVRALLVFLRFPLLEVAIADPGVFVRPDRPSRRLIDAIGSSSIGWTAEGATNRRYLQHVRATVQYILHSPGEAASAFAQAAEQFGSFLAENVSQDNDRLAKAKDALRQAETREIHAAEVASFLGEVLEGAQMEPYLRDFLLQVWARVLVEAAARETQHPGLVRRLLAAVPDLVWSVQPLTNPSDRKRLVDTIPTVLGNLRDGLRLIRWPDARLHELLNHLMHAHSHALKGSDSAPAAPSFSVSTVRIRLDGFRIDQLSGAPHEGPINVLDEAVHEVLGASGSGISHQWIRDKSQPAFDGLDAIQAEEAVAGWKEKTWFDLRIGEARTRVRLEWITPGRSLALFSAAAGDGLYSLSRQILVTYLRASWIAPTESSPLLERAFRLVLADLDRLSKAAAEGSDGDA